MQNLKNIAKLEIQVPRSMLKQTLKPIGYLWFTGFFTSDVIKRGPLICFSGIGDGVVKMMTSS